MAQIHFGGPEGDDVQPTTKLSVTLKQIIREEVESVLLSRADFDEVSGLAMADAAAAISGRVASRFGVKITIDVEDIL